MGIDGYSADRENIAARIWNPYAISETGRDQVEECGLRGSAESMSVAVIDRRTLLRQCFARSIEAEHQDIVISCFSSVEEWQLATAGPSPISLVLFFCGTHKTAANDQEIRALLANGKNIPVVLVSEEANAEEIQKTIHLGVRGFIPANIELRLAIMAMRLVVAGGVYLPENVLHSAEQQKSDESNDGKRELRSLFTERQAAVVEALRRGKPNKIIAYELNMRESTVKVHIRNVMKKLNAKNRTQVAFMINSLFPEAE
jgi:DNA-binding NarL/FixJ family response regulator